MSEKTINFLDDCKILHSYGNYHLAIYCGDRLCIVNKKGTEIGTLSSYVETDEDGVIHDSYHLIDWLGREFMKSYKPAPAQEPTYGGNNMLPEAKQQREQLAEALSELANPAQGETPITDHWSFETPQGKAVPAALCGRFEKRLAQKQSELDEANRLVNHWQNQHTHATECHGVTIRELAAMTAKRDALEEEMRLTIDAVNEFADDANTDDDHRLGIACIAEDLKLHLANYGKASDQKGE